jgi:hypothetical protein
MSLLQDKFLNETSLRIVMTEENIRKESLKHSYIAHLVYLKDKFIL